MVAADLDELLDDAPGFGQCGRCRFLQGGTAQLCYRCANRSVEALAPADRRCSICDLPFHEGESACRNPVCAMSERWFTCNYAIAMRSGELERAINAYKYQSQRGWAAIFGRILVGFLASHAPL